MTKPSKPEAPPAAPLEKARARVAELEAEREKIYPIWKAALEKSDGNIAFAGRLSVGGDPLLGIIKTKSVRDRAKRLTKRLDLNDYAKRLRNTR